MERQKPSLTYKVSSAVLNSIVGTEDFLPRQNKPYHWNIHSAKCLLKFQDFANILKPSTPKQSSFSKAFEYIIFEDISLT